MSISEDSIVISEIEDVPDAETSEPEVIQKADIADTSKQTEVYSLLTPDIINLEVASLKRRLDAIEKPKSPTEFLQFLEDVNQCIVCTPFLRYLIEYGPDDPRNTSTLRRGDTLVGMHLVPLIEDAVKYSRLNPHTLPRSYWQLVPILKKHHVLNWDPDYSFSGKYFPSRGPRVYLYDHIERIRRRLILDHGGLHVSAYPVFYGNVLWASHNRHYQNFQLYARAGYRNLARRKNVTDKDVEEFFYRHFERLAK